MELTDQNLTPDYPDLQFEGKDLPGVDPGKYKKARNIGLMNAVMIGSLGFLINGL